MSGASEYHSGRDGRRGSSTGRVVRVGTRNARFQQWQSLLTNRNKRQRGGEFLIQGVRPINMALAHDWPLRTLLYPAEQRLSRWARDVLDERDVPRVAIAPELLLELGERDADAPEIIAVGALPPDDPSRVALGPEGVGLVFDRPGSPGNIGTLVRSADAFGASGLIITGHGADLYDPKTVRASTGSLFALPSVRMSSARSVVDWAASQSAHGRPIRLIGADEDGSVELPDCDLSGPVLLVIGNETTGMSGAWRERCDEIVRIPIGGAASSLNAASAGTLVLYEAARQRGFPAS